MERNGLREMEEAAGRRAGGGQGRERCPEVRNRKAGEGEIRGGLSEDIASIPKDEAAFIGGGEGTEKP